MQAPDFPYEAHEQIMAPVDFTFFLNVPLEERRRRMDSRGHMEAHDRMTLNQENAEKIREMYLKYGRNPINGQFVELNCEGLSVEEIAHLIHEHITLETLR